MVLVSWPLNTVVLVLFVSTSLTLVQRCDKNWFREPGYDQSLLVEKEDISDRGPDWNVKRESNLLDERWENNWRRTGREDVTRLLRAEWHSGRRSIAEPWIRVDNAGIERLDKQRMVYEGHHENRDDRHTLSEIFRLVVDDEMIRFQPLKLDEKPDLQSQRLVEREETQRQRDLRRESRRLPERRGIVIRERASRRIERRLNGRFEDRRHQQDAQKSERVDRKERMADERERLSQDQVHRRVDEQLNDSPSQQEQRSHDRRYAALSRDLFDNSVKQLEVPNEQRQDRWERADRKQTRVEEEARRSERLEGRKAFHVENSTERRQERRREDFKRAEFSDTHKESDRQQNEREASQQRTDRVEPQSRIDTVRQISRDFEERSKTLAEQKDESRETVRSDQQGRTLDLLAERRERALQREVDQQCEDIPKTEYRGENVGERVERQDIRQHMKHESRERFYDATDRLEKRSRGGDRVDQRREKHGRSVRRRKNSLEGVDREQARRVNIRGGAVRVHRRENSRDRDTGRLEERTERDDRKDSRRHILRENPDRLDEATGRSREADRTDRRHEVIVRSEDAQENSRDRQDARQIITREKVVQVNRREDSRDRDSDRFKERVRNADRIDSRRKISRKGRDRLDEADQLEEKSSEADRADRRHENYARSEVRRENSRQRVDREDSRRRIGRDEPIRADRREVSRDRFEECTGHADRIDPMQRISRESRDRLHEDTEKGKEVNREASRADRRREDFDRSEDRQENSRDRDIGRFENRTRNADRIDSMRHIPHESRDRLAEVAVRLEERSSEADRADRRHEDHARRENSLQREDRKDSRRRIVRDKPIRADRRENSRDRLEECTEHADRTDSMQHISRESRDRFHEPTEQGKEVNRETARADRRCEDFDRSEDRRENSRKLLDREDTKRVISQEKTVRVDRRENSQDRDIGRFENRAKHADRIDSMRHISRESRDRLPETTVRLEERSSEADRVDRRHEDHARENSRDRVYREDARRVITREKTVWANLKNVAVQEDRIKRALDRLSDQRGENSNQSEDRQTLSEHNRERALYRVTDELHFVENRQKQLEVSREHLDWSKIRDEQREDSKERLTNQKFTVKRKLSIHVEHEVHRERFERLNIRSERHEVSKRQIYKVSPQERNDRDERQKVGSDRRESCRLEVAPAAMLKKSLTERREHFFNSQRSNRRYASKQNTDGANEGQGSQVDDRDYAQRFGKYIKPSLFSVIQGSLLAIVFMKSLSFDNKKFGNEILFKAMESTGNVKT